MDDKQKIDVFSYYLEKMTVEPIRRFTEFDIINLPEYFWTLPASTTRKNHHILYILLL